jgi:hypothetical protein
MNKFIVIKRSEFDEIATKEQKREMYNLRYAIARYRVANNKRSDRNYAVINLDEPYAPEIIEIMRKNGHWEDDDDGPN